MNELFHVIERSRTARVATLSPAIGVPGKPLAAGSGPPLVSDDCHERRPGQRSGLVALRGHAAGGGLSTTPAGAVRAAPSSRVAARRHEGSGHGGDHGGDGALHAAGAASPPPHKQSAGAASTAGATVVEAVGGTAWVLAALESVLARYDTEGTQVMDREEFAAMISEILL